jgi:hypothetical protein
MMRDRQPLTPNKRPSPLAQLNQQPVVQAEFNHQNRTVRPVKRRWRRWINRVLLAIVYGTAFSLLAVEIISLVAMHFGTKGMDFVNILSDWFRGFIVLSAVAATVTHFRRMFQTLALSANSIARERNANNWDMLVLTGIDARKIVLGKWWATVRHMWRPYVLMGILRALLIVSIGADANRSNYSYAVYSGFNAASYRGIIVPMLLQCIVAGAAVLMFTMANLFFTAACGMSAFNRRSGIALARAVATRFLLGIGIALFCFLFIRFYMDYSYPNSVPSIIAMGLFTIVDNGVAVGSQLATSNFSGYNSYGGSINPVFGVNLPAALIALMIYALLTVLLLRLAQWQAIRNSALPPFKRPLVKIV